MQIRRCWALTQQLPSPISPAAPSVIKRELRASHRKASYHSTGSLSYRACPAVLYDHRTTHDTISIAASLGVFSSLAALPLQHVVFGVALPRPVGARRSALRAVPHLRSPARPRVRTTEFPPYHRYSWLAGWSLAGVGSTGGSPPVKIPPTDVVVGHPFRQTGVTISPSRSVCGKR